MKKILLILTLILLLIPNNIYASEERKVNIYFFHSNTCSHCKEEKKLLEKIEDKYQNVSIYQYEIHDEDNISILNQVKRLYNITINAVPITVIGDTLYTGYSEKKSSVSFIKTIEYYSIYPYQDRVMEVIDPNYDSIPVVKQDVPTLKKFMSTYHSYSLLGINTDSTDTSTIALLLGGLTAINLTSIAFFIVVLLCLKYIGGKDNKIKLIAIYFSCLNFIRFCNIFKNTTINSIGYIILHLLFIIALFRYFKNKRRTYLTVDIYIILASLLEYINRCYYGEYILTLKNIASLHLLEGIEKIAYYGNYFICILLIDTIVMIITYLFFQKRLNS